MCVDSALKQGICSILSVFNRVSKVIFNKGFRRGIGDVSIGSLLRHANFYAYFISFIFPSSLSAVYCSHVKCNIPLPSPL